MKYVSMRVSFWCLLLFTFVCSPRVKAEEGNLASLFQLRGVQGTIVIRSLDGKTQYAHNMTRAQERFLPASTFKILNTLIALEEQVIQNEHEVIEWDGTDKGWEPWNTDHTLATALPLSCVWFYQELAKRIGNDVYLEHLQQVGYGNAQTGIDVTTFWLEGDLRISAMEQIDLMTRLYTENLPYSKANMHVVKQLMVAEQTPGYTIHAKTGWTQRVQPQIGWYVGYVECQGDVWVFAMNLNIEKKKEARFRQEITLEALKIMGIL